MASSFSELLGLHVTKQISLFPLLPYFEPAFHQSQPCFSGELCRHNALGPSMLHPRRVGDTVPKLDYTNVYRTHSSHLSAKMGMLTAAPATQKYCACHANIAPATKQTILHDVAESDEKENEGRMNAGPAARSKGSFQRKVGCSKWSLLALPACSIGRCLSFVTRSFR